MRYFIMILVYISLLNGIGHCVEKKVQKKYLCGDFTIVWYSIQSVDDWPMTISVIYPKCDSILYNNKNVESFVKSVLEKGHPTSDFISYTGIYEKIFNCWNNDVSIEAFAKWQLMVTYNNSDFSTSRPYLVLDSGKKITIRCMDVSGCFILDETPSTTSNSLNIESWIGHRVSYYNPVALFDYSKNESTKFIPIND